MTTATLPPNPTSSTPSLLERAQAGQLTPFESWPAQGLPDGYFAVKDAAQAADYYRENGFCVLDRVLNSSEIEALNAETARLCHNRDGKIAGIEPSAPGESDLEVLKRVLCIHFPHKISSLMLGTLRQPATIDLLTRVVSPNVKCLQSMLFVKASGKPGQAWHQDEDFIPTRDRSLIGAWMALDDATTTNGCLWVLPKSHRDGILWPQREHADRGFDCSHESFDFPWDDNDSIPVEMKAGSIVFFNGYLLHRSLANRAASGFRRSLVNHFMSAESLLPWKMGPEDKRVAIADYRDIVMVAGKDPYAYKGTTSIATPLVRASGEGGCESWAKKAV